MEVDAKGVEQLGSSPNNPFPCHSFLRERHLQPSSSPPSPLMAPPRILLCGDVLGGLNQLFKRVAS
ncbi:hypothetical protein TorRG33x02_141000, partial [Trema orientale]